MSNKSIEVVKNSALDLIRGFAALAVLGGHLRALLFIDYGNLVGTSLFVKAFYYFTGFGHQAVVVFFVLSGYLVGGSVLNCKETSFWSRYLVQRLSRLWTVLLPCLILTFIINRVGAETGGAAYLTGLLNPPINTAPPSPVELGVTVFGANLLFLHTIFVPVFGDNRPLWSLANEFWYYVLFPLLFWGVRARHTRYLARRALCLVLALGIAWAMPAGMRSGFVVWCMGVAIYVLVRRYPLSPTWVWGGFGATLAGCALVFHRSRMAEVSDLWLGLAFAPLLFFMSRCRLPSAWLAKAAERMSDFSYTLYVSHFSVMAFVWYTFLGAKRVQPTVQALAIYAGLFGLFLLYAYGLYWLFERNTPSVRKWMQARVNVLFGRNA